MFVSKVRFENTIDRLDREDNDLRKRYWELRHDLGKLLDHLGLEEHTDPERTYIRKKASTKGETG